MAKYEKTVRGDFHSIVSRLDSAVLNGSMSASLEDTVTYSIDGFKSTTRVYERYSYFGKNRVSMALTVTGKDGLYHVSAITSGGSQAMFFKINTIGEESFLDTISGAIESL